MAALLGRAQGWPVRAQAKLLPDGRRLHLSDGPIDIVLEAFGAVVEIRAAYDAAVSRFVSVLDELCAELPALRGAVNHRGCVLKGPIAQRMLVAVRPYAQKHFITPMAAVAGAVAEEILLAMTGAANLQRAYVNDGGDIALHIVPGEHFMIGMVDYSSLDESYRGPISIFGTMVLDSATPVRGIATSGWRGRSFSLGIADAVTVLAPTAAMADAAATIIANAVNLPEHPAIGRVPARELDPKSDLLDLLVTTNVGHLNGQEIASALDAGVAMAETLQEKQLIHSAALHLYGETRIVTHGSIEARTGMHQEARLIYA
jgi:ApbE superfamily uncharacterized protein (UPF0280 family)